MKRGTYRIGGALLLVGALQFILSLAVAESLRRGYSVSSNYLSDLGVGHLAVLFNASVATLGAFAILGAYFLFRSSKVHTLPYLIAVSGFGALGVGLFPETIGLPHLCKQGRGGEPDQGACRGVRCQWHTCQCHSAGVLPERNDGGGTA